MVYLCSFYDDYGYKTLLLKKMGKITCPVALASMGVFSEGALSHKALKKKIFINICKLFGLFRGILWSVLLKWKRKMLNEKLERIFAML